jgi:lysophospholipase L1-like esterase
MRRMLPVQGSGGRPILVIILLGTNDLKMRFSVSAYDIAYGAGALAQIVQKGEISELGGSMIQ